MPFKYSLTTEGSSDSLLMRHIDWLLNEHSSVEFDGDWANPDVFSDVSRDVHTRIQQTIRYYPCDLLFIHRDADVDGHAVRKAEIVTAIQGVTDCPPAICVVPVRMTEAWLLSDITAIRRASGNPRGSNKIHLPAAHEIEHRADPKGILNRALVLASEANGRKLAQFKRRISEAKHSVARYTTDYSVLRQLPAFSAFETDLQATLAGNGWV